jgi:hypothetical protein
MEESPNLQILSKKHKKIRVWFFKAGYNFFCSFLKMINFSSEENSEVFDFVYTFNAELINFNLSKKRATLGRVSLGVMGQKPPNKKPPVKSIRSYASKQKSPDQNASSSGQKASGHMLPNKNHPIKMPPAQVKKHPVICFQTKITRSKCLQVKKHPVKCLP